MAWRLELADEAKRQLRKLDPVIGERLLAYMRDRVIVLEDPRKHGKAMQGQPDLWLYRMGDWRIVARVEYDRVVITVVKFGKRGDVYRVRR